MHADNYNYFRDYDPGIGRYVESDPIGLSGGINTYGYVEADPLAKADPDGKQVAQGARAGASIGAAIGSLFPGPGTTIGAALGLVVGGAGTYLICRSFTQDESEECRKEREACSEKCTEAQYDPDLRHLFGGSMSQCIKNCLPEKCGGEPKWKGFKDRK